MKQIKTICIRLNDADAFDKKVNEALEEGWMLTERRVLQPPTSDKYTMLYAELEKHTITEAERCCENCKHFDTSANMEPCLSCSDSASNWEDDDA